MTESDAAKHAEVAQPNEHNGVRSTSRCAMRVISSSACTSNITLRESYSMTRVADRAGLERTHLYRKLKQLGIELSRGARRTIVPDDAPSAHEVPAARNEPPVYSQRSHEYDD